MAEASHWASATRGSGRAIVASGNYGRRHRSGPRVGQLGSAVCRGPLAHHPYRDSAFSVRCADRPCPLAAARPDRQREGGGLTRRNAPAAQVDLRIFRPSTTVMPLCIASISGLRGDSLPRFNSRLVQAILGTRVGAGHPPRRARPGPRPRRDAVADDGGWGRQRIGSGFGRQDRAHRRLADRVAARVLRCCLSVLHDLTSLYLISAMFGCFRADGIGRAMPYRPRIDAFS